MNWVKSNPWQGLNNAKQNKKTRGRNNHQLKHRSSTEWHSIDWRGLRYLQRFLIRNIWLPGYSNHIFYTESSLLLLLEVWMAEGKPMLPPKAPSMLLHYQILFMPRRFQSMIWPKRICLRHWGSDVWTHRLCKWWQRPFLPLKHPSLLKILVSNKYSLCGNVLSCVPKHSCVNIMQNILKSCCTRWCLYSRAQTNM